MTMSSTINPIEVEAFEQIQASSRMALLRLIFRPASEPQAPASISRLLVDNHNSIHRIAPLPALPSPGGMERAAFAVPNELLNGDRTFSLEFEDGFVVELPYPALASAGPAAQGPERLSSSQAAPAFSAPEGQVVGAGMVTEPLEPGHEERLLAETEARAAAEDEIAALQTELQQVRARAEEHARGLETRSAELERRLAEALAELEAVTRAERRAVRETLALKDKVAQQAALIDQLRATPD